MLDRFGQIEPKLLIVVDGLQGHLMEALARGEPADPFLAAIAEAQRRGVGMDWGVEWWLRDGVRRGIAARSDGQR